MSGIIIKGTLIDHKANSVSIGASSADNAGDWPFSENLFRGTVKVEEVTVLKQGHRHNGSGTLFSITDRVVWMLQNPLKTK